MSIVTPSLTYWPNPSIGRPLFNGTVYVGEPDLDPTIPANQKQITLRLEDGALVPVGQPLTLGAGGVLEYNGSYAVITADGEYSVAAYAQNGTLAFYIPNNEGLFDASDITYNSTTVGEYLDNLEIYIIEDSYSDVRALDSSEIADGKHIQVSGYPDPWEVKTGTVVDNGWYLVFDDDSNRYAESTAANPYPQIFGATGEADDTATIDAFFSHLASVGGSGYLGDENNTYLVDSLQYENPANSFSVYGKATLKKRTNSASSVLQIEDTQRTGVTVIFKDFHVDGDYTTHGDGNHGIVGSNVSNFICDNITVNDVISSGIITFNSTEGITNITQANPAVVTYSTNDDFEDGDLVHIGDVTGMTEINGTMAIVSNLDTGSNTFELTGVDSTSYTAYVSDGTAAILTKNVILRDCVINGEGNARNGLVIVDSIHSGIENGRVFDVTEFALELKNACNRCWIRGGIVDGCDLYGIELGQTSGSGPFNNQISDVILKAVDGGIEMSNGEWNSFSNIHMDFDGAPGTVNGVINCSSSVSNNTFSGMTAINVPANIYGVRFRTDNSNNVCHFTSLDKTNSSDTVRFDATASGNTVTCDRYSIAGALQESIYDTVSDASTSKDNVIHYTRNNTQSQYTKEFADGDATPSIVAASVFETNNTGATTITDFDDGSNSQQITVVFGDSNTTIDFTSTSLKGNGGANWSPSPDDSMICTLIGSNWYCQISDNSA